MCGRTITGDVSWEQYHEWMGIIRGPSTPDLRARYNVAPTTMSPIFIADGVNKLGVMARWGLIPHWFRQTAADMKFSTFNARSEEAHAKPMFRDAMRNKHCLVPVQGYYEWKGAKGNKTPYMISVVTNAPAFCLAGLYSKIELPDFNGYTYTVLTEDSSEPIKDLHNRMPVMLDESSYDDWLNGTTSISDVSRVDPNRIKFHQVGKAVGNVRNDDSSLIDEVV